MRLSGLHALCLPNFPQTGQREDLVEQTGQRIMNSHNSGESKRPLTPILLKSIAIHLPCLSQLFCKRMPSSWQKVVHMPPICITTRLPFVSRYFCRSIRVRGRWHTPKQLTCLLNGLRGVEPLNQTSLYGTTWPKSNGDHLGWFRIGKLAEHQVNLYTVQLLRDKEFMATKGSSAGCNPKCNRNQTMDRHGILNLHIAMFWRMEPTVWLTPQKLSESGTLEVYICEKQLQWNCQCKFLTAGVVWRWTRSLSRELVLHSWTPVSTSYGDWSTTCVASRVYHSSQR